ncbi:MAG: chromosome segregation protein SMC [Anaerolineales bacterium]
MPSRLTSLELQGYKTFASRTEFVFAENVTAIVGPNGSGKSNIADSIRWVLGEQSYSLLRGKKTEDMIFAGSEQRARAGMASATIVFDNSDGWLPIDFSEVAITRRAYRDGQNEYLLNNQRVRLRDVSELLAQSGLAERTYTIIGQGLVDAALSLKAEERRRLFEEAAGIGLHRSRREEALKRLDTTRRNMERVKDILAELQPRLRSLERQARRAQEYELVMADLRVQLREWYGYHWHRAQFELGEALELARGKEKLLEDTRESMAGLEDQAAALRGKIQSLRAQLGDWHRQSSKLHTQRESLSRDLAVSDERLRALLRQRQEWTKEIERLEEQISVSTERVAEAGAEAQQLQTELDEARQQVSLVQKNLDERISEQSQAERQMQSARQALTGLTARQAHLHARLAERESQAQRQAETLSQVANVLDTAEGERQAAYLALQAAAERLTQAESLRSSSEAALQEGRHSLAEVEAARASALQEHSALQADITRLQAKLEVIEQAERALSGYAGGVQLLMQAARQTQISGELRPLSSLLEVPLEYETAIAAGLGEFLDAVLMEDSGLETALGILAGKTARAALLPIENLNPNPTRVLLAEDSSQNILGIAADLVQAPVEIRPVIELLLGKVVVARERASALRFLKNHSQSTPDLRVVTLQGEVFYASGPVLAGQEGKPAPLSRPRELRELRASLDTLNHQLEESGAHLQSIENQLAELRSHTEQLVQQARQARQGEESARTAHNNSDVLLDKTIRQSQWQREQQARLQAELEQGEAEAANMRAELLGLEDEINQARELLRERNAILEEYSLEEVQTQLSHWKMRAAVAERALTDAHTRHAERKAALDSLGQSLRNLNSKVAEAKLALQELEGGKNALSQMEIEVNDQVEALRILIQPAEAELRKAEQEQTALQTRENKARQSLSQAEHYHAQARIQQARRQEALESMRRRIEDDFGLVAFEYNDDVSGPTPLPLDGMVEQLPKVDKLSPEADENIKRQRAQLRRMGAINPEAQLEYQQVKERFEFLNSQIADLLQAESGVREVIAELDLLIEREFRKTFDAVAQEFREIFARLFGGGFAKLVLTDPDDMTGTGIDIEARLPGRRSQGLSLLSGGERSLTATALVFAILKVSPTPFCVLDEVDAMLDEANVGRFRELLRELSASTQFVIVTHNRNTVQVADVIYGVTMGRDSSSQVISLKLDQVNQLVE